MNDPEVPNNLATAEELSRERGAAIWGKVENAYEREPVPESAFKGWLQFLGLFVSRHTAGTEFAIGPLFVARGATATDVVAGLVIGNMLATLSWRFICAPIATRARLTTFVQLERAVGKKLVYVYDFITVVSLTLVGGAMLTVSATAVGVLFDVKMPGLSDWLPTSFAFVVTVIVCGAVTTVVAVFGVSFVTMFGTVVSPVLIAGIIYLFVQSLRMLGIGGENGGLWEILNDKVYTGVVQDESFSRFGFAQCVFFAWFCDLQLNVAQNDLSLLRYARKDRIGWASAAGMFVGHYFAWIVAGCMYAVQLQDDPNNTSVAPGPIANLVGGGFGLVVVVIAGWSTANPILYAAGLAFQHVFPTTKTWQTTLLVGSASTFAALFPGFTSRVLELLVFAGLLLCPLGVILFADFWILPKMGIGSEMAHDSANGVGGTTNWPAVWSWLLSEIVTIPVALLTVLGVFFTPLLTIALALGLHLGLSYHMRERSDKIEDSESTEGGGFTTSEDSSNAGEIAVGQATDVQNP